MCLASRAVIERRTPRTLAAFLQSSTVEAERRGFPDAQLREVRVARIQQIVELTARHCTRNAKHWRVEFLRPVRAEATRGQRRRRLPPASRHRARNVNELVLDLHGHN